MFRGTKLILFLGPRLVVLERDHTPGIPWPGYLDLPGGGRDGAETPQQTTLRETYEEIGLRLSPDDLIWSHQRAQSWFFAAQWPASAETDIRFGNEGLGWSLMDPHDFIAHPKAIPHFAEMVVLYLSQKEK